MRYRDCENCGIEIDAREVVETCPNCKKNINKPKTEKMKNPFKVKDTVHHIKHGKGLVIEVQTDTVLVKYENESHWHNDLTLLSFTPYTLEGFTQERPFEPVVGQMYYFWDDDYLDNEVVLCGKLSNIHNDSLFKYQAGKYGNYKHISETNPLL